MTIKKTLLWIAIPLAVRWGCAVAACAPVKPAAEQVRACDQTAPVKACREQVMISCFAASAAFDEDQCVTKSTAEALIECLKFCP